MRDHLDAAAETLIRESDISLYGTADFDRLQEKWSDAAWAAALAARTAKGRAKASGFKDAPWRIEARQAYLAKGGDPAPGSAPQKRMQSTLRKAGVTDAKLAAYKKEDRPAIQKAAARSTATGF